jgi:hypothetical protein
MRTLLSRLKVSPGSGKRTLDAKHKNLDTFLIDSRFLQPITYAINYVSIIPTEDEDILC